MNDGAYSADLVTLNTMTCRRCRLLRPIVSFDVNRWGKRRSCRDCAAARRLELAAEKQKYGGLRDVHFGMMQRCTNQNNGHFRNYGGRGIQVCDEWRSFQVFHEWARAHGYADGLTIERRDNNSGYSPENCYFATRKTQARNRRSNRIVTIKGVSKCVAEWSEEHGIPKYAVYARVKQGWAIEAAVTTPYVSSRSHRKST
jgi:hypothetical protein